MRKKMVKLEDNIKELMRNLDYVSAGILSNRVCKDTLKLMFRVSLDIVKRRFKEWLIM